MFQVCPGSATKSGVVVGVEVAEGSGLGWGVAVADGVGLDLGVEVADGREVADGGGISVAVGAVGVSISPVGVVLCRVNGVAASATPSPGRSTVGETEDGATGASMEGTMVVSIAGAQANTRIA